MRKHTLLFIWMIILLIKGNTLFALNQASTHADSVQFFWNKYIKNAVYEVNPCNGFACVHDIPVNNLVKYALNHYYQNKGFTALAHYQENVTIYQIPYQEVLKIINEHFGIKIPRIQELEEAVYDSNKQIISFDPRILSFYQQKNFHIFNPVLEEVRQISVNTVSLKVSFYKKPDKKELINTITYKMIKMKPDTYVFYSAEYQVNPHIYDQPYESYRQISFNVDPQFYKNLHYLGSLNGKLYFVVRDFLSGIFNFYVIDQNTLKTVQQKSFFFGRKKVTFKYGFSETDISIIFKDKKILMSHDLKKWNEENVVKSEQKYEVDPEKEMIYQEYASINRYGEFYMNELYGSVRESSIDNESMVKGTFYRKKGEKEYKKLEIPGLEEDRAYRIDSKAVLGDNFVYFTSRRYNGNLYQPVYSLNFIDLNTLKYQKDIIVSDKPFLNLSDCLNIHQLLSTKENKLGETYFYILSLK